MLVLDSGAVSRLAERSRRSVALIATLRTTGSWPPVVPAPVLIEALHGYSGTDAQTNRLLKACNVIEQVPQKLARRAALLRHLAGRGSAIDALVTAMAEPGGTVLTSDLADLRALAAHASDVLVERI